MSKSREVIFSIYFILIRFLGSGDQYESETLWPEEVTREVRVLEPSTCGECRSFWARSAWSRTNQGIRMLASNLYKDVLGEMAIYVWWNYRPES